MISLSENLCRYADDIARTRDRENAQAGVQSLKCSPSRSDGEISRLGAFGEVAFSWLTDLPMNHTTGGPAHVPDVGKWEVKVTTRKDGNLMVPWHRMHRYRTRTPMVLLYVKRPMFEIRGWNWAHVFVGRAECLDSSLPTPAYVCPELLPWDKVPEELMKP